MKKQLLKLNLLSGLAKLALPLVLITASVAVKGQCTINTAPPTSSGCQYGDAIDFLSINGISSPVSAGCSGGPVGYLNNTTFNWIITAGASTSFSANVGGGTYSQGFGIWIDLNKDGIYQNTENMFNNGAFLVHANTFTVPLTVASGTYNLRARCAYAATQVTACDNISFGEAEDYVVKINNGVALNFDGVNDYVTVGNTINTTFNSTNKLTLEAWVKPSTNTGNGEIVGNYNTAGTNMQFLLRRDANNFSFWTNNGSFTAVFSVATVTLNAWTHLAGTWDGTTMRLYVNGLPSGTAAATGSFVTNTNPIFIGGDFASEYFNGNIDEVRIWNRALCQSEIQNNMNAQLGLPQSNLAAYYQFNQGIQFGNNPTETSLINALGAVNTGTLINLALTTGSTSNWVAPGGVTSIIPAPAFNVLAVAGPTAICLGNSALFTASSPASGMTYTWSTSANTTTISVTPTVTTSYSVAATNTVGCAGINVFTVTVNAKPTVSVTSGAICSGNSFTIVPSGASTYTISGGSAVVTPTANANYNVTGTSAQGCVSSNTAVSSVTVNATPSVSVTSGAICAGNSFTIVPSGANTYTISGGSAVVTPTANANYNVTGTSTQGCVSSNTAVSSVTVNALPTVSVTSGVICAGNSFTIVGSGASTYTFSSGSAIVSPTANANYNVTGTSAQGCVSSNTAVSSVTVNAAPNTSAAASASAICAGQSVNFTASGATTYSWNTTATTASITASPSVTTVYSVIGTNTVTGCTKTATTSVVVNALPTVSAITSTSLTCTGQTATLTANGASTYTWNTSATAAVIVINPTVTTTYTVNGTDVNGCANVTTVTQNVSACTGINALTSNVQSAINVYPNPTTGILNVELEIVNGATTKIEITNMLGQIVLSQTTNIQHSTFNISHLKNGLYILKAESNGVVKTVRLVKD